MDHLWLLVGWWLVFGTGVAVLAAIGIRDIWCGVRMLRGGR